MDLGNKFLFADEMPYLEPILFHRTVIFILKLDKVCTDPDAYRGLSMQEGYFKYYSKILADTMQMVMGVIQSLEQFGFTKGKGFMKASRTVVLDGIQ